MSKKILITGGTGFAGSHLVECLLEQGEQEIHVTSMGSHHGFVHQLLHPSKIHALDLTDQQATAELLERVKPDQIYHLASIARSGSSFIEAREILTNNSLLQINLLESVRDVVPSARVLCVSSADCYDASETALAESDPVKPSNPYAVSKYTQELLADAYSKAFGLKIIKVRPFNHIGERQTPAFAIPAFAQQIAMIEAGQQDTLSVGNLTAVRDMSDVKDVVVAYRLIMEKGALGEVYNIGSGRGQVMQELLDQLISLSSVPVQVVTDPNRMRPSDTPHIVANISKLTQLGWQPSHLLNETLERVLNYWRTQVPSS